MKHIIQKFRSGKHGQALTEFAITLPVLLLLIFGVIEFGRLLFSWLAVQNAARMGLRYAITGQYDDGYCDEAATALYYETGIDYVSADLVDGKSDCFIPSSYSNSAELSEDLVDWARLPSILDVTRAGGAGLYVKDSVLGSYTSFLGSHNIGDIGQPDEDGYFHATICSTRFNYDKYNYDIPMCKDKVSGALMDDAGFPGDRVFVEVSYQHPMLLPFISSLWPNVSLKSHREGIVEKYRTSRLQAEIGVFTPMPTWTPTITATTEGGITPTNTSTPTSTPYPPCVDISIKDFSVDTAGFRFEIDNDSGHSIVLNKLVFNWENYRSIMVPNQHITQIDIGDPTHFPTEVSQWASSVVGFSSQYSTPAYGAVQALGAPDTGSCGDLSTAWAPLSDSDAPEYLHLKYSTPVYATGIRVHETFVGGFIKAIEVVETDGTHHTVSMYTDNTSCGGWYDLSFKATSYRVDEVIIHTAVSGWEEIDAVELLGYLTQPTGQIAIVYPSPNDVSPIIESVNASLPTGDTGITVNFKEGQVSNGTDTGDFGLLLTIDDSGTICVLEKPVTNPPPPPPTATPIPPPSLTPTPTITPDPYAIVPGPDGEIWYRVEGDGGYEGDAWVHVEWHTNPDGSVTTKTTFSETFVDNTYDSSCGAIDPMAMVDPMDPVPDDPDCFDNSIGWESEDGHTYQELWHSDHVQIDFKALDGSTIFAGTFDYIEEDGTNGGVTDGDGSVESGSAGDIISATSSMTENVNLDCYDPAIHTIESPKADEYYIQDPSDPSYCPGWEYSVWYETTLSADAFENFGYPLITYIHASPSKASDDKPIVVPGPTVAPTPTVTLAPSNTPDWTPTNTPTPSPTFTPTPTETPIATPACPPDDPRYPDC